MNWNKAKILAGRVGRTAFLFAIVMTFFALSAVAEDDLSQLKMMAEQGNADAQNYLGVMYNTGTGVTQDKKEAVEWFKKSAEQGNALAQANLGVMYRDGMGVTQDDEEAVEWWKKAAEQENAIAQYNLGVMYGKGIGVTQSDEKAVYWLTKAAEQGDEDAIEVLKKLEELENNQ